jgi:hypothetical protein
MHTKTISKARSGALRQISIYAENKVGRLHDVMRLLSNNNVHIMALTTLDTTDSAILRFVIDDTEKALELLTTYNYSFSVTDVIGVEIETEQYIKRITAALVEAEINIHYIYPFIMRPSGKSGLVLKLEDVDLACDIFKRQHIKVLSESDISR